MLVLSVSKHVLLLELRLNREGDESPHPCDRGLGRKPKQIFRQAGCEDPRATHAGMAVDGNILTLPEQRSDLIKRSIPSALRGSREVWHGVIDHLETSLLIK